MTPSEGGPIHLELSRSEALVLFEYLSRAWERRGMAFEDAAEQHVLWAVEGQLQKILAEPFRADYRDLVHQAREEVWARLGDELSPMNG